MRRLGYITALIGIALSGCGTTSVTVSTPERSGPQKFGTIPNAIPLSQKGAANGVATLNGSSKLTEAQAPGNVLLKAENLKDLTSAITARVNLGLGSASTEPSSAFDAKGAATTAQTAAETASDAKGLAAAEKTRAEAAESGKLAKAENLKDLVSAATARTNLGLGSSALEPSSAFDAKGAAATAQAAAEAASEPKGTVATEKTRAEAAEALKAPLASPTLTGIPAAPTAAAKTNTTQLASTAFTQVAKKEAEEASIPLTQKGANSGVAELNSSGFLLAGEIPANVLLTTSEQTIPAWKALTLYAKGAEVMQEHVLYWAKAEFTSGSSFSATNWERGVAVTEKGVASGVAELTSGGVVPEAELPTSVPLAKEKALGEVEGTVSLNLEEGSTFTATLKKNVTFKITKAPSRPTEVSLVLTENSTGGWTWSVESLSWVGSEPTFPTTKGSKSFESVVVNKAGGEILGIAGLEGKTGATGATGPTGAEGAKGANGEGVPTGGTTGQFLKKKSSTNFDTEWGTGSGGESELTFAAVESLGTNVEQQGGEYGEAKYAVGGTGRVYLAGALKIKAELVANKLVLTLPTGARPTVKKECWVYNLNSAKEGQSLTIKTNGEVLNNGTSAVTWVFDLDGCTYSKGA